MLPFGGWRDQFCSLGAEMGSKSFPRVRFGSEFAPQGGTWGRLCPDLPLGPRHLSLTTSTI